jgi:hypothetical protein
MNKSRDIPADLEEIVSNIIAYENEKNNQQEYVERLYIEDYYQEETLDDDKKEEGSWKIEISL